MGLTRIRAEQISDIDYKQAVRVIQTSNVNLTGGAPSTVDGVSLLANDRILVNGQSSGAENGIYRVQTVGTGADGTWVRTSDANSSGEIEAGMIIMVTEGVLYADTQWKLTTNNPIVIGTTPLTFIINILSAVGGANTQIQYNNSGTLGATANLTWDGSQLYVNGLGNITGNLVVDTNTLFVNAANNTVGIGTITPTELLHLKSTGPARLLIEADSDNITEQDNAQILLSQDGGAVTGRVGYITNGNALEIWNNYGDAILLGTTNTERLRILATGNVGIANNSPVHTLAVTGTGYFSGNITGGNVSGAIITGTSSVIGGGITLTANTISSADSTMTIDPSAAGATGTVVIAGNLQVQGTTTTIDSTTVTINDLVFTIANNAASSSAANGGGIEVGPLGGPYATWLYDQPNARWTTALGINATGNITAGNITTAGIGTLNSLSVSGNIVSGNLTATGIAGTLSTATQPNITSVGQLTSLGVTGNVTAGNVSGTNLSGTLTTAAQTNITSVGTLTTLAVSGNVNVGSNINNTGGNGTGNIGSSTTYFNTVFAKATSAQYADLAEKYTADAFYESGTVVVFGGQSEITVSTAYAQMNIAGVISTDPAYIMNAGAAGFPVALQGRVPCRVTGTIRKGDLITSSEIEGVATRLDPADWVPGCVIGKALANYDSDEVGVIEVVVGRV